jgi:hypothetical protein
MPNLQLEAAANGATSFRESMGMLGDAEDKAKRPVVTPDTVKLPPCGNPIGWGKLKVVFSVRLPQSLDRRLGTNAKSLLFPFCPTKKKISRPIQANEGKKGRKKSNKKVKACEKRRASFRRSHKMKSDREPSPEAPVGAAGNAGYSGDHPGETSDDDEAKLDKLCLYVFIMISRNSYYGLTKRFRKTFHKIRLVFELKNHFLVIPHSRRPRTTATA